MRRNSAGIDLNDAAMVGPLAAAMAEADSESWYAGPIIGGRMNNENSRPATNPADRRLAIGYVTDAASFDVEAAVDEVRRQIDHTYLNEVEGLDVPSLENVARWLWRELDTRIPGLDRVTLVRGRDGQREGCSFRAPG